MKGIDGAKEIAGIMDKLRKDPPKRFAEWNVINFRDYESGRVKNLQTGTESSTGLPKSNVLYFELDNDAWCCARPSGTEPKIKFYMGVRGNSLDDSQKKVEELTEAVKACL